MMKLKITGLMMCLLIARAGHAGEFGTQCFGPDAIGQYANTLCQYVDTSLKNGYHKTDHKITYVGTWDWCNGVYGANHLRMCVRQGVTTLPLDVDSFEQMNARYAKDKTHVFLGTYQFDSADPKTFELLTEPYAKDKRQVYYGEQVLSGANPLTFKWLTLPYAQDDTHIYYKGDKLEGVDLASFKLLDDGYAQDKNNIYFHAKKLGKNFGDFKTLTHFYAKDKKGVYCGGRRLNADPQSFKVFDDKDSNMFGYDSERLFFYESSIKVESKTLFRYSTSIFRDAHFEYEPNGTIEKRPYQHIRRFEVVIDLDASLKSRLSSNSKLYVRLFIPADEQYGGKFKQNRFFAEKVKRNPHFPLTLYFESKKGKLPTIFDRHNFIGVAAFVSETGLKRGEDRALRESREVFRSPGKSVQFTLHEVLHAFTAAPRLITVFDSSEKN